MEGGGRCRNSSQAVSDQVCSGLVCQGEDESPDPWQPSVKCEVWGPDIWICRSVGTCGGQHEISHWLGGHSTGNSSRRSSQSRVWWSLVKSGEGSHSNNLIKRHILNWQDDPSSPSTPVPRSSLKTKSLVLCLIGGIARCSFSLVEMEDLDLAMSVK